jgi:hypothetical protein
VTSAGWVLVALAPIPVALAVAWLLEDDKSLIPFPSVELVDPTCDGDNEATGPINAKVTASVFTGPDVTDEELEEQLARAASYFSMYSITFVQEGDALNIPDTWMVGGTQEGIRAALADLDLDPDGPTGGTDAATTRDVVCEVSLSPLIGFLSDYAEEPKPHHVNIVLMRKIAQPGSTAAGMLPNLRGLTIAADQVPNLELMDCLGVDETTVPSVFVSLDEIAHRRPATVDVTLPHELGHVFGLTHDDSEDGLMGTEPPRCLPFLTQAEWKIVADSPFFAD